MVLIGVVALLELTNTTHFFHAGPAVSGKIPVIKNGKTSDTSKKTDNKPASQPSNEETPQASDKSNDGVALETNQSSLTLQEPFGTFVSNHSPSLSGSAELRQEQSVCNTTPGAKCAMTFTNNSGVVKSLPVQTADSNGAVYWTWDVKVAGFTTGAWKITATADLNGQTKSASDQINLNVKP